MIAAPNAAAHAGVERDIRGLTATATSTMIVPVGVFRHGTGMLSALTQRQAVLYEPPRLRAHADN